MTLSSVGGIRQSMFPDFEEPPRREAIKRFIAQREESYLRHYAKLCPPGEPATNSPRDPRLPFALSWLWPAFLLTIPWMFYRKMYTGGIILVALPVFLDHLLPNSVFLGSGILIAITAGLCGKSWYLEHVVRRLAKARRLFAEETRCAAYLHRARGVSLSAGIYGALIQIVTATVIVLDLLPPNRF